MKTGKEIVKILQERHELINSLLEPLKNKLANLPEGRIKIKRRRDKVYYYLTGNGDDTGETVLGSEEMGLISDLVQKSYLNDVLYASKKECSFLEQILNNYPKTQMEDIYDTLSDERKRLVKPIITPIEQFVKEWEETPYKRKPIGDDVPVYMTLKGERVRSKSEQFIADRLFLNGIPYKYECPLKVGNKVIHPDFTILRRSDRKIVYHEHLGRLDETKYTKLALPRITDYILNGFELGDKLFLSLESSESPLDIRVIDRMIEEHYR